MTLEERMEQIKEESLAKGEKKGIKKGKETGKKETIELFVERLKKASHKDDEIIHLMMTGFGFSKEEAEKWLEECS